MSRRNLTLIILAIIILSIGGFLFFYFSSNNAGAPGTNSPQNTTTPFGNTSGNKTGSTSAQTTGENNQTPPTTQSSAQLIQVYRNPSSGSLFFMNKNKQVVLRFTDRAVGNIYEYLPISQTGSPQRLTNTTIPKIQETAWSSSGNGLVLRYLDGDTDNIISFSGNISVATSSGSLGEITGSFLPANIKQLAINPGGNKIFGIMDKSDKSGTYGFTTNLDGSLKKIIMDSPISYWNISWPKDYIIALNTKPDFMDKGLLYFLNTQTLSIDRILGNITGLSTTVNKDASLVAYSYSSGNSFALDVYDVTNKISRGLVMSTLADKCVWGNNDSKVLYCAIPQNINSDNYPDAWYQGLESFSDNIWKIDTGSGAVTELYQIGSNENASIDAIDLKISPDDKYLSFSNKKDLSLWLLQIIK